MLRTSGLQLGTLQRSRPSAHRRWPTRLAIMLALALSAAAAAWFFVIRPGIAVTPPIEEAVAVVTDQPDNGLETAGALDASSPARFPPTPPSSLPETNPVPGGLPGGGASPLPGSPVPTPSPVAPATQTLPPIEPNFRPRPPQDVFEAQVAMTRDGICSGSIDGAWGGQTRAAIVAYQQKHQLRITGQLDTATRESLTLREPPLTYYTVTAEDFARLRPLPRGWLARSELDRMDYSTVLELVAEKSWTNPNHIKRLNPAVDWTKITAGTSVRVPRVSRKGSGGRPTMIVISLSAKTLQLLDSQSVVLAHFPCSIAKKVEKRPAGELSVVTTAPHPDYTFNPANFPDSAEAQKIGRSLKLQPGPNNPVGVAWITLSLTVPDAVALSNFGIHGSPEPEQIGRTESSGCFRLANWNAEYLLQYVHAGMRVMVEP